MAKTKLDKELALKIAKEAQKASKTKKWVLPPIRNLISKLQYYLRVVIMKFSNFTKKELP